MVGLGINMFFKILFYCYWEYCIWYSFGGGKFWQDYKDWYEKYKVSEMEEIEPRKRKIYAIDFDKTICYTEYPTIIKPIPYAIEVLKILMNDKYSTLILYTCRHDKDLEEAIHYLKIYGIEFDYVNENDKEMIEKYGDCRKIYADVYIDDHNYMGNTSIEELWKNWYEYLTK